MCVKDFFFGGGEGVHPCFSVLEYYCKTGNWIMTGFKAIYKKNAVFPAEIIQSLPCLNQLQL